MSHLARGGVGQVHADTGGGATGRRLAGKRALVAVGVREDWVVVQPLVDCLQARLVQLVATEPQAKNCQEMVTDQAELAWKVSRRAVP